MRTGSGRRDGARAPGGRGRPGGRFREGGRSPAGPVALDRQAPPGERAVQGWSDDNGPACVDPRRAAARARGHARRTPLRRRTPCTGVVLPHDVSAVPRLDPGLGASLPAVGQVLVDQVPPGTTDSNSGWWTYGASSAASKRVHATSVRVDAKTSARGLMAGLGGGPTGPGAGDAVGPAVGSREGTPWPMAGWPWAFANQPWSGLWQACHTLRPAPGPGAR